MRTLLPPQTYPNAPNPINRYSPRHALPVGQPPFSQAPIYQRMPPPGVPNNLNTDQTHRTDYPYMQQNYNIPVGKGQVDWTESGPIRESLHMDTYEYRYMTKAPRWNPEPWLNNGKTDGMHSATPVALKFSRQAAQTAGTIPTMTTQKRSMLTVQRYAGQSYSATLPVLNPR